MPLVALSDTSTETPAATITVPAQPVSPTQIIRVATRRIRRRIEIGILTVGFNSTGARRNTDQENIPDRAAKSTERAGGRARGRTWWFGILLGVLLVAAGIAETVRLVRTGDGGFAFWFGTLVGGGVLILVGTLLLPRRPVVGCALTGLGCLAGLLPTMWTIVVPMLLVALAIAAARRAAATVAREAMPN